MSWFRSVSAVLTVAVLAGAVWAQDENEVTVTLDSGDRITGALVAQTADSVTIAHPALGTLVVPRANIVGSTQELIDPAEEAAAEEAAAEDAAEEVFEPFSFWEGWKRSAELGLNGSEGNTERLSLRAALVAERATERMETVASLRYVYAREDSEDTENRFRARARNEWLVQDSKWRYWAQGGIEYDEFQDFDWRLTAFGGVGYEFIKNDKTELIGRAGLGAAYDIGGEDDDIRPEGLLGLDFKHQFTERQSMSAFVEYYPSFDDTSEFRLEAGAEYAILIDSESNMSLKLGIEDRYDSDPGPDTQRNDFEYYALLIWEF